MRQALALCFAAFLACGDDATGSRRTGACPEVELLVAASDYQSAVACGAPGCFEETGKTTARQLGADPVLVSSGGQTFFVARDEDKLFSVDSSCGLPNGQAIDLTSLRRVDEKGVTRSAYPHDVAVADDGTLLVTLYGTPGLAFVEDGVVGPMLDLSTYDDDGNPQAESVRIVNGKAFVTLERLDDGSNPPLQSKRASWMLRVDVATRTPEATIELAGRNPFNAMAQLGAALYLAEPNSFERIDDEFGGIERFDTETSTTRMLVPEKDIGASVLEVAVTKGCGAALVAGPEPNVNPTAVITFDPDTGAVLRSFSNPVLGPTPNFDLAGIVWRAGKLYVGDRRKSANGFYPVHELSRSGACELTETGRNLDIPQPPVGLQAANILAADIP